MKERIRKREYEVTALKDAEWKKTEGGEKVSGDEVEEKKRGGGRRS